MMKKQMRLVLGALAIIAIIAVSMVVAFYIARANLAKDFKPVSDGELLVTLEYASEKEKEDSVQTTATMAFYDDHTCHVEGKISSMYDWSYTTNWSVSDTLVLEDTGGVKAECTDEASLAFIQMLSLDTEYNMDIKQTLTQADGGLVISVVGLEAEKGDTLMELTFKLDGEKAAKLGIQ